MERFTGQRSASYVDDDVFRFNRDRYCLCRIRPFDEVPAGLDLDRIALHPDARRIDAGFSSADVELPAVPGTAQDLALARIFVAAGLRRRDQAGELALAQVSALMRATVAQ